jgi:glycosyltransferase involved in cell wall biosynthesis
VARVLIVIPIYRDWEALALLLPRLDDALRHVNVAAAILLVDDGSPVGAPPGLCDGPYKAIRAVDVLTLRRNMGHQRAIAIALAHAHERVHADAVVVMDGDGEDAPEDVPRLLTRLSEVEPGTVVFAERTRRSENLTFRVLYNLYRWTHYGLTGIPVRVGNFSVVPARALARLVVVSELWNHYAAGVFKSRLSRATVPTRRASRLHGRSQMDFVSLVGHGLSALSVHAETIGVRALVATLAMNVALGMLLLAALAIRLGTSLAIPGWATAAVGLLAVLLMQGIGLAVLFVFIVLQGRSHALFIPLRDYAVFVESVTPLYPQP